VWFDATIAGVSETVIVVDDHPGFRAVARSLLEAEGYTVLGEAADGAQAVSTADALRPDIVLLDVILPDTSGFAVAELLAALPMPPATILISSHQASDFGDRVRRAPAIGFISKADLSGPGLRALLEAGR
jgi:DNA-binding NarL/FixJ family response regulator